MRRFGPEDSFFYEMKAEKSQSAFVAFGFKPFDQQKSPDSRKK